MCDALESRLLSLKVMDSSYWLVNSNRSRIKRFIENTNNKDQFFKYIFIDSGKVNSTWGKETIFMTTWEELKKAAAREEWKKLIAQSWRNTWEEWTKKRELGLLILNRRLNNTQLLTNGDSSSKRFIRFKLFLPKSKSINLAFLLTNLL